MVVQAGRRGRGPLSPSLRSPRKLLGTDSTEIERVCTTLMKGFAVGDQRADPSTYGTLRAAGLSPQRNRAHRNRHPGRYGGYGIG